MELGERLKRAREEAGLTQLALCGDTVTRNMLSQIENGAAHPSLETLQALAQRLGKPVSYFLGEETAPPETQILARAWSALESGRDVLAALDGYAGASENAEYVLLLWLGLVARAEREADKPVYARELLTRAKGLEERFPLTVLPELCERRRLAAARVDGADGETFPDLDASLMARAQVQPEHAGALLDACEDRLSPRWQLLRGQSYYRDRQYEAAARCLHAAEKVYPVQTAPLLEHCCAALGDYKGAYRYACIQRDK